MTATILNSTILIASIIIVILIVIIIKIYNQFKKEKINFERIIEELEEIIEKNEYTNKIQDNQLLISNEFDQKIKVINTTLSTDILDVNYELFETLSKNNLL